MQVLVTGGTGYIGSHTVVELQKAGHEIVIVDNLCNSTTAVLPRIEAITGKMPVFVEADICDRDAMRKLFDDYAIDAVIHFAGLKAVGESTKQPARYYQNNVSGSLVLFDVMSEFGCKKLVFSSSATVYGDKNPSPYQEHMPTGATSPYGQTKLMIERILADFAGADEQWHIASLRYFNPIGAHESGTIGEDPNGIPNNLMPYIAQVAVGRLPHLNVFGDDYKTKDGTGVRDYIHVVDLALGHCRALEALNALPGFNAINLGSGDGVSVLELVKAFELASEIEIPYQVAPRRAGDIDAFWADASKAKQQLDWQTERNLQQMVEDTWRWQSNNPNGYK